MNSVISSQYIAPHLLPNNRLSPSHSSLSTSNAMISRKRKADDNFGGGDNDERMSASPSGSPAVASRPLQRHTTKKMRTNISGRPLPLPRLLETLNADEMRNMLRSICEHNPQIGAEVVSTAPRPSVSSTLDVLSNYESAFQAAFPFGGRASSDYSYNRVRQPLLALLDALKDFTPHFLPPNEPQPATSLAFLDGATEVIHRLPNWDTYQHNRHKYDAYEEMAKAWASVIREASKKAGGIQLQYGGWDQKIAKHNETSGGRMQEALEELRGSLGWMGGENTNQGAGSGGNTMSVREQLLNGTYGMNAPVRVGPW
ncbi:tethering factor for nuclear proteasome sts1 [Delitschia confertaspora ATCC 74209]|uniref:Tethering factor for nuclear proteasome STS1 n=1 Tax=Delitschia confertaspora ATCC 74209 TaxID=1513339 RepID=A0A9P4JEQ6_9PLEO|nr:tethering factor for nuclear proteasome sts1 [Delitschia confertaspora ATCC 74209]